MSEVSLKITADGKAATASIQQVQGALKGVGEQASQAVASLQATGKATTGLSASLSDLGRASIIFSAVSNAAGNMADAMMQLPKSGIEFAAQTETTKLGIAGILSSMTAINGQTTTYAQGLALASEITSKLQRDAMLTAASTQELVSAFQAMVGPGLAAGMSLDQIRQLSTTGVNAVKALGLSGTQVVQELRDLVQGGITPASSTLATALGLKDEDIAKAKSSTEGLFSFLMQRLKGFDEAGTAFADSFTGRMQALSEQLVRSSATIFEPLANTLKDQAKGISDALSDEGNVAQFQKLTSGVQAAATALGELTQFAIKHSDAIMTVASAYAAIQIGVRVSGWAAEATALVQATLATREKAIAEQAALVVKREALAAELAAAQVNFASADRAARYAMLQQQIIPLQRQHAQAITQVEEATKRLSIAQNLANAATSGMSAVLGALGGPVGIAITAVTLLIGKLMEMRGEAEQTALAGLSKERIQAAAAAGKKADDMDVARVTSQINQLKTERDKLVLDQKDGGITAWLFGNDYAVGLESKLKNINAEIKSSEAVVTAATTVMQTSGAQVQLQGNMAMQQIDQLLAKYNTAAQLTQAAKKDKDALDTQLKNVKNSNASAADIAQKERDVAAAKVLIERKLQDDLKQLREHGMAETQAISNAQLALDKAQAQLRLVLERSMLDQKEHAVEMAHSRGLMSESEYYAQRFDLQRQAMQAELDAVKTEIDKINELRANANLRAADRIGLEEKLISLTTKSAEISSKYNKAQMGAGEAVSKIAFEYGKTIDQSNDRLNLEISLMGKSEQVRATALAQYDIEVELQRKILEIKKQLANQDEQDAAIASVKASAERAKQAAAQQVYLSEWKRSTDQISQSLSDALMRGGKSGWDYIKDLVRTTVLKPIIQMVATPIAGVLSTALGFGAPANAAGVGTAGSMTSSLGMASTVNSIYKTITSSFTSLGDSVAFAAHDMGAWLVNNTTGILNQAGGTLMESAGAVGQFASYAGGALAGYGIGTAVSGKYAAFGDQNVAVVGGTAIGAILGGPIGAAIGGAIGGVVNRAFGMGSQETTDYGIKGSLSTAGASVSQYQNWKQDGGWFRSDRSGTNLSAINAQMQTLLDASLQLTTEATKGYAKSIGLSADAVYGYTQSINLSLKDLDQAGQEKAIANALSGFGESLIQTAYGEILSGFSKSSETLSQTLTRLSSSLSAVNQVFDTLSIRLIDIGVVGADVASKLLDAFGGSDTFVKATSAYYDAFYSDAERVATTTRQVSAALRDLGIVMPDTKEALRALVEAQDLTTDSGRKNYAALMSMVSGFKVIFDAQEKAAADAAKAQQDYVRALQDSGKKISDWLAGLSTSSFDRSNPERSLADTRTNYTQTLQLARGGDQTALAEITGRAEGYLQAAMSTSTSSSQYQAILAQVKAELGDLPAAKTYQLQTLSALEAINMAIVEGFGDGLYGITTGFAKLDANVDGLLTFDELVNGLQGKATNSQIMALISSVDSNGDGQISAIEAQTAVNQLIVKNISSGLFNIATNFATLDSDVNGLLTFDELKRGLSDKASDNQIKALIAAIDTNGDGQISALEAQTAVTQMLKSSTDGVATNTDGLSTNMGAQLRTLLAISNDGIYAVSKNSSSALDYLAAIKSYVGNIDISTAKTAANPTTVVNNGGGGGVISRTLSAFGFAQGDVFGGAGIYTKPTYFSFEGNLGALGEAGSPEAVMPLERMADGALGVRSLQQLVIDRYVTMGDTSALETRIDQLIEDGRRQAYAMVEMQMRMTKLFERWDGNGLPETRVIA